MVCQLRPLGLHLSGTWRPIISVRAHMCDCEKMCPRAHVRACVALVLLCKIVRACTHTIQDCVFSPNAGLAPYISSISSPDPIWWPCILLCGAFSLGKQSSRKGSYECGTARFWRPCPPLQKAPAVTSGRQGEPMPGPGMSVHCVLRKN